MKNYGMELIIDLHDCDTKKFTRTQIGKYFDTMIEVLEMEKGDRYFWDDVGVPKKYRQTDPKTKGTTAIQFILTSNITIHTLDILKQVYINIFSCKEFKTMMALAYTHDFFKGEVMSLRKIDRI